VRVKRNIALEKFERGGRKVKRWERRQGDGGD
jgi:hypothetical protein